MMRLINLFIFASLAGGVSLASAQTLSPITVEVSAVTGVSTSGLTVCLTGEESGFVFDPVKVNASGVARFSYVPEGVYTLSVDGSSLGLENFVDRNVVHSEAQTVKVVLNEAVRTPYALAAALQHDEFSGQNSALISWNRETDYFFDDFESYEPFAIEFSPWSGYDIDREPAVEIVGLYPNRGIPQYATIFNPLTIDPPVYYEYEVLRPYSGKQCVGFVRTRSGNANNDWLVSPKIKVGVDNVVSFMAKASETVPDRFAVCVSRTGNNLNDFVQLTPGNYETVDYKGWKEISYSLADYEGEEVYVAIHCVSQGSFMFMVDDFYVGPKALPKLSRRVSRRSAANPNEIFVVSVDGNEVASTPDYEFLIPSVAEGSHTVGVKAKYVIAETEESTVTLDVPGKDSYASLILEAVADADDVSLEGYRVSLINKESGRLSVATLDGEGHASIVSLPKGEYLVNLESEIFDDYNGSIVLDGDKTLEIPLYETVVAPYNLTYEVLAAEGNSADVELSWNRNIGYTEDFESYEDFTQEIGDWTVLDLDKMPTYAFSIGGTLIEWPVSRDLVGAMVFNPEATRPVPASDDGLFISPDGYKYAFFNSAESAMSNDWLISPELKIGKDYVWRFTAKSYQDFYPGLFEFCVVKEKDIASPTILDSFYLEDEWQRYELSLSDYEGEKIEVAFHHTTFDGWISFIDDVYVGPREQSSADDAVTSRCNFDVFLDNVFVGNVASPLFRLSGLSLGEHTAGVEAVFPSGKRSQRSEISFTVGESGVEAILGEDSSSDAWQWFDVRGLRVDENSLAPGIYIRSNGIRSEKIVIR